MISLSASRRNSYHLTKEVGIYNIYDPKRKLLLLENAAKRDDAHSTQPHYFSFVPIIKHLSLELPTHRTLAVGIPNSAETLRLNPAELRHDDARPLVFANKIFWTRAHALLYMEFKWLLQSENQHEQVQRYVQQLQVGSDVTLQDAATARDCLGQWLREQHPAGSLPQHGEGAVAVMDPERQQQDENESLRNILAILRATISQYPEIKVLLEAIWSHGSFLFYENDKVSTKALAYLYLEWCGLPFSKKWFNAMYSTIEDNLKRAGHQANQSVTSVCVRFGSMVVPYSNVVPGYEFTPSLFSDLPLWDHHQQHVFTAIDHHGVRRCQKTLLQVSWNDRDDDNDRGFDSSQYQREYIALRCYG